MTPLPTALTSACRPSRAPAGRRGRRGGFTLIELLVVMAITAALGLLALMLLPSISNSDAALKGTEEVRAQCKISQALAASARQPRGVRFLTGSVPTNPQAATELQLLESPPVTVLDPLTLQAPPKAGDADGQNRVNAAPFVELIYDVTPPPPNTGGPPAGQVFDRQCKIYRLTSDQADQVQDGSLLALPTLGFWSRVTVTPTNPRVVSLPYVVNGVQCFDVTTPLDVYPDAAMGAATAYRTYHAGIYGPPVPLLGQPTIPLPKNIAVDLEVSEPPASPAVGTYDLMFAPDGQNITLGRQSRNTGVFLWVRDITKVVNPAGPNPTSMLRGNFAPAAPAASAAYATAFRLGGEHHAVGINNGAVGVAPIQWPDATGLYPPGSGGPFGLARKKLN